MEITAAGRASVWWDMQRCPLPPHFDPYVVTSLAPALLHKFNIIDVNGGSDGCRSINDYHFSAYEFFSETQTELYQTLINSGIRLHQVPPDKSIEMEKMMIADVLLWAMDTPPPANIIFIVGSVDFCYVFQKLWQRSYNIFLVCPSVSQMPKDMLSAANGCLEWLTFLGSLQDKDHPSQSPRGNSVNDHTFSNTAFPASSTSVRHREMEESNNASGLKYSRETLLSLRPSLGAGWDTTCSLPLHETGSSPLQTEAGFHGHFIRTNKPSSPVSSVSSAEKNKSASLEEFKAWLNQVVNGKKHAENGYYIGPIHTDFWTATGTILDEKLLDFQISEIL